MFQRIIDDKVFRVTFLLLPKFSLMAFASAVEPLRVANRLSAKSLYEWSLVSGDGGPVFCSGGLGTVVDDALRSDLVTEMLVVVASFDPAESVSAQTLSWLRRMAGKGIWVTGVDTGSYVMAMAGLLDSQRATTHWEHHEIFRHDFPRVKLSQDVFVADGRRLTAAGGTACIDMMLNMIRDQHGYALATQVSDQFIYSRIRAGSDTQRMTLRDRLDVSNPVVVRTVEIMEQNTEDLLSTRELARRADISLRELERLFRRWMDITPGRYYRQLRLTKARTMLLHSTSSVTDVALNCGFSSVASFSRSYKSMFGHAPSAGRMNA
jgi:transcriptional regulator GlxA family with amidase domain